MKDAQTYRRYAEECMKLAQAMPKHREQLVTMAKTWEQLANAAERGKKQED